MNLPVEEKIKATVRDVPDFPKVGILFKDIAPIFADAKLCNDIADEIIARLQTKPDAICAIESRGFFFGMLLAHKLQIPLIPVRKKGKLPGRVRSFEYALEYGSAVLEIQCDVIQSGWNVLIHDDVLATGGTAVAAAELVQQEGGKILGFQFLAELSFLDGRKHLLPISKDVTSLVEY